MSLIKIVSSEWLTSSTLLSKSCFTNIRNNARIDTNPDTSVVALIAVKSINVTLLGIIDVDRLSITSVLEGLSMIVSGAR